MGYVATHFPFEIYTSVVCEQLRFLCVSLQQSQTNRNGPLALKNCAVESVKMLMKTLLF